MPILIKIFQQFKTENGNIIMLHAQIIQYLNKIYIYVDYNPQIFIQVMRELGYQFVNLVYNFLLSAGAVGLFLG